MIEEYKKRLRCSDILAKILDTKQYPIDDAYMILYDQMTLISIDESEPIVGMEDSVRKFIECLREGRDIYVYADYDVDGMTAGTIMLKFLSQFDNYSEVYFPERSDGYGLSKAFIEDKVERYKDGLKPLIITVDNGITKVDEVNLCNEHDIPIIITDHHLPGKTLPDTVVTDPWIKETNDWSNGLCGAGVAYYFCREIERQLGRNHYKSDQLIYLAAIGTLADVMPLNKYNQALVRRGFDDIDNHKIPNTLITFINLLTSYPINSDFVQWDLAPRLNACSRMFNIGASIELFKPSNDPLEICNEVEGYNVERKKLTKDFTKKIIDDYVDDSEIAFVRRDDIPHGIIGILAGKLQDYTGKPSFVGVGDGDIISGSARSMTYPLNWLLNEVPAVVSYGGHAAACGFTIYQSMVDDFKQALDAKILNYTPSDDVDQEVVTREYIDIAIKDLTLKNYNEINKLAYDNMSFLPPLMRLTDVVVLDINTSKNNELNVKFTIFDGQNKIDLWSWGTGDLGIKKGDHVTITGSITKNFMKPKQFTLRIEEIIRG